MVLNKIAEIQQQQANSLAKFLQTVDFDEQFAFSEEEEIRVSKIQHQEAFEALKIASGAAATFAALSKLRALRKAINKQRRLRAIALKKAGAGDVVPPAQMAAAEQEEASAQAGETTAGGEEEEEGAETGAPEGPPKPPPPPPPPGAGGAPGKAEAGGEDADAGVPKIAGTEEELKKSAKYLQDEGEEAPPLDGSSPGQAPAGEEGAPPPEAKEEKEKDKEKDKKDEDKVPPKQESQAARDLKKEQQQDKKKDGKEKDAKAGGDKVKKGGERGARNKLDAQKRAQKSKSAKAKKGKAKKSKAKKPKKKKGGIPLIEKGVEDIKPWPGTLDYWWASVTDLEAILECEFIEFCISLIYINAHALLGYIGIGGVDKLGLREWVVLALIDLALFFTMLSSMSGMILLIMVFLAPLMMGTFGKWALENLLPIVGDLLWELIKSGGLK